MKIVRKFLLSALLAVSLVPFLSAQEEDLDNYGPKPQKAEEVRRLDAENAKRHAGDPDVLVLPGLVAKRKDKRVEVLVESTGVAAEDAAEFLVVHTKSYHGYEAFMWSYAMPGDIHRALEFIGVPAGQPLDPGKLRFWRRGEPVVVSVQGADGATVADLDEMIYDREAEKSMAGQGFVFTGSIKIPDPNDPAKEIYVADHYNPHSVISAFNDSTAVLDVGWQVSKGEAYNSYVINPDYAVPGHELFTLVLEPKSKEGGSRARNLILDVEDAQTFLLKDAATGAAMIPEKTVGAALEACRALIEKGLQPYVTLRFDTKLQLAEIQRVCAGMAMLDQPGAICIDPPMPGHLYYRSFLPNQAWREPRNRQSQAWEIHLRHEDGKLTATMVLNEPVWQKGSANPDFEKWSAEAADGDAVRKKLDADAAERRNASKRQLPQVLMVFAPANLTYGKLLEFLGPALKTHNTVHLFLEN